MDGEIGINMRQLHIDITDRDCDAKLLPAFAREGFPLRFPGLDLAADKFPEQSSRLVRRALTDEKAPRIFRIVDKRCNDFNHGHILNVFYFMVDSSAQKVKEPDECARIEYRGKTLPERAEFAMESIISLKDMEPGTQGIITDILPECALSRRLLDLGFAEGAGIRCLFRSMFGDPTAYEICGTVIALRAGDSASVLVRLPHEAKT